MEDAEDVLQAPMPTRSGSASSSIGSESPTTLHGSLLSRQQPSPVSGLPASLSPYAQAFVPPPGIPKRGSSAPQATTPGLLLTPDATAALTDAASGDGNAHLRNALASFNRRLPPKYAEAAGMPKLRGGALVAEAAMGGMAPAPLAAPSPRDDVCLCTPELEEMIKELIKVLMQFQERARLRDSVKAKKVRHGVEGGSGHM